MPDSDGHMSVAKEGLRAEYFLAAILAGGGFDTTALADLDVIDSGPNRCVCRLHVSKKVCNRYGTLHGGCIATLVDVVGSAALVTVSDKGGVSLGINTLYLNPMPAGEDVDIDARVVKLGKDIATVEVTLKRTSTGDVVAHGTHVKKLIPASDLSALFQHMEQQMQQQPRLPQVSEQQEHQQQRWKKLKQQWQQQVSTDRAEDCQQQTQQQARLESSRSQLRSRL